MENPRSKIVELNGELSIAMFDYQNQKYSYCFFPTEST